MPLREPLASQLASGRIVSLGWHARDPYSSAQVGFNYASYWGLFQYAGYANLMSNLHARHVTGLVADDGRRLRFDAVYKPAEIPFERFERWGVAWYLLGRNAEDPGETPRYEELLAGRGMRRVAADSRRIVFHDPRAEPLVYLVAADGRRDGRTRMAGAEPALQRLTADALAQGNGEQGSLDGGGREALQPRIGGRSLTVSFPPSNQSRALVACFLAVPGFTAATLDGRSLTLRSDEGRMTVDVPAGATGVRFVYHEPELLRGLLHAAALMSVPLLAWGAAVGRKRLRRQR